MQKNVQNIQVNVYITDVSSLNDPILYNKFLGTVPKYRVEKINSFTFPKDRNLCLGAGILLGYALKQAGYDEQTLEIAYGEFDKPYFKNHPEMDFNLAHSGERAMCAIAVSDRPVGNEIGCDVEECTREQVEYLNSQNMTLPQWTKIESYAKATQTDLENLFFGKAKVTPGFIFTCPEIEPQYNYTICCRSQIPGENIHFIDLKELAASIK